MWSLRRAFVCVVLCAFILGSVCVVRFRVTRVQTPEFLPNSPRFRTNRVCGLRALVLVNSAAGNDRRRQVIRETWGHPTITKTLDMSVAFGVGSVVDSQSQRSLDWEAEIFGDIFQASVPDSYASLSQKLMSVLEMAAGACEERQKFIIKVDDDVFVNIFALGELLETLKRQVSEQTIGCLVWQGMPVIRSNSSKWSVSQEQFRNISYPTYCSGSAYIINSKIVDLLLQAHKLRQKKENIFPLEDVYITGILAKEAGLTHYQLGTRYAFESIRKEKVANGSVVFAHLGTRFLDMTERLWDAVMWARRTNHDNVVGL